MEARLKARVKLALVSVLRNEMDVAPAFLRHAGALFDAAVLMDHHSMDGTAELLTAACAGRPGWHSWRIALPGYHQREFSAFAMRHLFERTDADMVLFLDADEFIDVASRAELERALASLRHEREVGRFVWINCVPRRLDRASLRIGDVIWANPEPSRFKKIVVPRAFFEATCGRACPSMGNHVVTPGDGGEVRYQPVGSLLHLPIRSMEQMKRKMVLGALVEIGRASRAPNENLHWIDAAARIAAGTTTEADLAGVALRYGEPATSCPPVQRPALAASFVRRRLDVAAQRGVPRVATAPADPWRLVAEIVAQRSVADADPPALALRGSVLERE